MGSPTREEVLDALTDALLGRRSAPMGPARRINQAADAVMALLAAHDQDHRVLWTGPVGQLAASLLGKNPRERGWDPGTVVDVVSRDTTEADR